MTCLMWTETRSEQVLNAESVMQDASGGRGAHQPGLLGEGAPQLHGAVHIGSALCPK